MSSDTDGRFDDLLSAFAEDRAAFRAIIVDLRARGEAALAEIERVRDRSDRMAADLERLKDDLDASKEDVYKNLGALLEDAQQQRRDAQEVVLSAGSAIEGLRSEAERDLEISSDRAASSIAAINSQAEHELRDLAGRAHADLQALQAAASRLEAGLEERLVLIETRIRDHGARLDIAQEGLLQATAETTDLFDGLADLRQTGGDVQARVDRGERAVARVAGRTRALAQLRWAIGLVAAGVGVALGCVSGALGIVWGNPGLGWAIGALEAAPWFGVGVWVLWLSAPEPRASRGAPSVASPDGSAPPGDQAAEEEVVAAGTPDAPNGLPQVVPQAGHDGGGVGQDA